VYRKTFAPSAKTSAEKLKAESHLTQDFAVMSAGLRAAAGGGSEAHAEIYFLQQHYGIPTRLLDWTTSPLAALYFATSGDEEDDKHDGELFMIDAYAVAPGEGIATSGRKEFLEALEHITKWKSEKNPNLLLPVRPDHFDRRISLQRSCFTFHGSKKQVFPSAQSIQIPASRKTDIRRQLAVAGVDHFTIFGDLESLAKRLIDAYR
jgi:hypothetical protein